MSRHCAANRSQKKPCAQRNDPHIFRCHRKDFTLCAQQAQERFGKEEKYCSQQNAEQQEQPSRAGEAIMLFSFIVLRSENRMMNAARQTDARSHRLNKCGNR